MKNKALKDKICIVLILASFSLLILFEVFNKELFSAFLKSESAKAITTRLIASLLALVLVIYFDLTSFLKFNFLNNRSGYLLIIPCAVIAINNFPFVPFLSGELLFSFSGYDMALFGIECLLVGFFEEMAYRACVFGLILRHKRKTIKDIFVSVVLSSLVFGASHLINIVAGASAPAVILQTGYSFLIGAMCAFVMLNTGSVWPCIAIHAVYNFCGGVAPRFAQGNIWTQGEVLFTAALSIVIIIYVCLQMLKIKPARIDRFYE